jgi:hypothetical protein
VAEAFVAWSVAAFGIGLAYAPISLMMLRVAPRGREGWSSASLNLSDVLGQALGIGIGGAAITAVTRSHLSVSTGVAIAFGVAALGSVATFLVSYRLPRTLPAGVRADADADLT